MTWFPESKATSADKQHRWQMLHEERMRAIELGQSLPEVEESRAQTMQTRARAVAGSIILRTIFMALGPAAICGISIGATNVILTQADPSLHRQLVMTVWVAAAAISMMLIAGIAFIGQQAYPTDFLRGQAQDKQLMDKFLQASNEFAKGPRA